MAAYVITDVVITDADLFAEFRAKLDPTVESRGGKFIVRGEDIEVVLGDWTSSRLVVIEFPDVEAAKSWAHSTEFCALKDMLSASSNTNIVIVDGM